MPSKHARQAIRPSLKNPDELPSCNMLENRNESGAVKRMLEAARKSLSGIEGVVTSSGSSNGPAASKAGGVMDGNGGACKGNMGLPAGKG